MCGIERRNQTAIKDIVEPNESKSLVVAFHLESEFFEDFHSPIEKQAQNSAYSCRQFSIVVMTRFLPGRRPLKDRLCLRCLTRSI